ncbi:MAG: FtsQ-type POTRA domain-containing protein, partial [Bdellovibrionales bacterium]|nr:FtsQ-type POTRA domain-containing protein [Bdellovibrionales bacterium]
MRVLSKFIIVLVALATLSLLLFVSDKSFFQLHNISIGQIDHSAKSWMFDDIKLTIDKETQAYMGKYMWEVDLKDLMNHVLQDQRVSKVQVQRKFPNSIEVKVAAHEPVLMMITKAKGVLPIARDGNFMPALHTGLFLNVPILQGPALENDIELRKSAVKLLLSMGKTTLLNVQ